MKVLLTGGAGFIGFHVARALLGRGHTVICVDNLNRYYDVSLKKARLQILQKRKRFVFRKVDIADYRSLVKAVSRYKIDKVCHLAAQAGVRYSLDFPLTYDRSNIQGTINIFELAVSRRISHVVAASSSSVYGSNKRIPFRETDTTENPLSVYAATKRATEHMGYVYSKSHGMNVSCLRFFTVYGPWGRPDMALFKFANNMLAGKPIDVYNYGRMQRDFTYVGDIASGVVAALERPFRYEVFNLGNSKSVHLSHLIACLEKELGIAAERRLLPIQKGDVPKTFADVRKSMRMLRWKPKTGVEQGVKEFVKWYKKHY